MKSYEYMQRIYNEILIAIHDEHLTSMYQVYRVSRDRPWWNQVLSSPACVCSLKAYIRQLQLNQEA